MENQTPNTDANNTTQESTVVKPSFTSNIKGLPIAVAGEQAKAPANVTMKFLYADTVMSADKKTWMRLHFEGISLPIFRNLKQAGADLSNYIDKTTADFMTELAFESAYNKHYRNKDVHMSASAYDVDSVYTVDENSTAYKAGNAQIGDSLSAESAGIRIDGFLRALLNEAENNALYEEQIAFARQQAQAVNSGAKFTIS